MEEGDNINQALYIPSVSYVDGPYADQTFATVFQSVNVPPNEFYRERPGLPQTVHTRNRLFVYIYIYIML